MMNIKSLNQGCDRCHQKTDNYTQVKSSEWVCDECLNNDYTKCFMCGEYDLTTEMFDTEGKVNGGIGKVCENCRRDM